MKKILSLVIAGTLLAGIVMFAEQDKTGSKTMNKKKKKKKLDTSPEKKK